MLHLSCFDASLVSRFTVLKQSVQNRACSHLIKANSLIRIFKVVSSIDWHNQGDSPLRCGRTILQSYKVRDAREKQGKEANTEASRNFD